MKEAKLRMCICIYHLYLGLGLLLLRGLGDLLYLLGLEERVQGSIQILPVVIDKDKNVFVIPGFFFMKAL